MIKLFDYQEDLVTGAYKLWGDGFRRIAMVMATGGGKTPTFSRIAGDCVAAGQAVLVLAHRKELIDSAIDKLQQVNPGLRVGMLKGGVKEHRAPVVVASVATAATPATLPLLRMRQWGLIIVDETHHVVAATYLRILRELGAFEPDGPLVLGVTATLGRADRKALGDVFEAVVEPQIGLLDLIRRGRLVRPRGIRVRIAGLDISRIRKVAGDLGQQQLGAAMSAAMAPQRIVEAWREHAAGRMTIAFMPSIEISREVVQAFNDSGVPAAHLDGSTPDDVRDATLDELRARKIMLVSNVGLFTEGTDIPGVECVILKMTSSGILYQQMVGRGLRLDPDNPGKVDCIILDPTGVTGRHKLATMKSLSGVDEDEGIPDDLLMYEEEPEEEADDEPAEDAGKPVTEYEDGKLEHELFDLFGQSHSAWLRTEGGRWFLPTPTGFIYLEKVEHGRYDLCWAVEPTYRGARTRERGVIQPNMQIEYAMAAGDDYVAAQPAWQASRNAAWRRDDERARRHDARAVERASAALDAQ